MSITTTTIYSEDNPSGRIASWAYVNYALARAGGYAKNLGTDQMTVGQAAYSNGWYYCWEGHDEFDTSALDGEHVWTVVAHLHGDANHSSVDFITEARLAPAWITESSLVVADWIPGDDLAGKTLLATFDSADYTDEAYNEFTSETVFKDSLVKDGLTYIVWCSKEMTDSSAPSLSLEYITWRASDGGDTEDPKLVVEHTTPQPDTVGTHF